MSANDEASAQAKVHVREEICENTFKTASHNGTIVLIGPTRNGKSTLGNLLVHGADDQDAEPAFAEGDGAESETRKCSVATVTDEAKFEHAILDTPGFGDTNGQDHVLQLHLAESLVALSGAGYGVSLFVMVVRRNNGLGPEYKELIKLYRRLLGKFFEDNLQIVFTGSAERDLERMETRAQKMVKMGPFGAMDKVRRETCELLGLAEDQVPLMFVDAVPGTDEDKKRATAVRRTLFEKARVTEAWVPTTFDRIPKVLSWVNKDNEEIARLEGKLEGSVLEVSKNKDRATDLLRKEKELRARLLETQREAEDTRTWLREYDTDTKEYQFYHREIYVANSKRMPSRDTKELLLNLRHPVLEVYITDAFFTSGGRFEILDDERKQVRLVLNSGFFWQGATRTVAITTSYSDVFAKDIVEHRGTARFLDLTIKDLRKKQGQLCSEMQGLEKEHEGLVTDMATTTEAAVKLGEPTLSLREFKARCEPESIISPLDLSLVPIPNSP